MSQSFIIYTYYKNRNLLHNNVQSLQGNYYATKYTIKSIAGSTKELVRTRHIGPTS